MNPTPEEYARILQTSMQEALSKVDVVMEEARKIREEALEELARARDKRQEIERKAREQAEEYLNSHHEAITRNIREDIQKKLALKLLEAGRTAEEVMQWLEISPGALSSAQFSLETQSMNRNKARLEYNEQGRGGTITFREGEVNILFHYEFGGGNALVLIFIPSKEQWVAHTGTPIHERARILRFLAEQVIREKAPGYQYQLFDQVLEILKP